MKHFFNNQNRKHYHRKKRAEKMHIPKKKQKKQNEINERKGKERRMIQMLCQTTKILSKNN